MTHVEQAKRRKAIAQAIVKGDSRADVAQRFKVCDATVRLACLTHRVPVPSPTDRGHKRHEEIAKAADEGADMASLCRRFKVSDSTVYHACNKFGVILPHNVSVNRNTTRHPFDVLAALKAPGKVSDAEVGRQYGLTRERVRQLKWHAIRKGLL